MRRSGRNGSDHGGWHYVRVVHGALVLCHVSMHSDFLTLVCRRAIANMVPGIDVFVTGGLGGVHRGCETTMGTLCGVRRWLWVKRAEMVTGCANRCVSRPIGAGAHPDRRGLCWRQVHPGHWQNTRGVGNQCNASCSLLLHRKLDTDLVVLCVVGMRAQRVCRVSPSPATAQMNSLRSGHLAAVFRCRAGWIRPNKWQP